MRNIVNDQNDKVQDMIWRSREGDLSAFQQLVEHYQHYAYILAFRLLGDDEDAKDAVQEAFIRVWKHIKNFNLSSKFTTWFYRIVTNLCLDRIKAQKRKNRFFRKVSGRTNCWFPPTKKTRKKTASTNILPEQ